uniref:Uncharacterized protein n=1 Tax=Arion vulgaris TaxID=1028688 RepID=A0A0B6ZEU2_9EUPU
MDQTEVKMTLAERENLMKSNIPHYSGFTPQRLQSLTQRRKPLTMADIECHHFLRTSTQEFTHQHPTVEHRLWTEAGKTAVPIPSRPDTSYNSNIWRNFCRQYGLNVSADGRTMTESVAALYPLNIPAPSQIGDYTFDKYLRETNVFQNKTAKSIAIRRAATDINLFKNLKYRTQARNPPLNEKGDILPPENFKKYAHRFVSFPSPPPTPPPPEQRPDMFGQLYTPRTRPHMWKLSYKLNHPKFQKLQEEVKAKRKMMEAMRKTNVGSSLPQLLPSPLSRASDV